MSKLNIEEKNVVTQIQNELSCWKKINPKDVIVHIDCMYSDSLKYSYCVYPELSLIGSYKDMFGSEYLENRLDALQDCLSKIKTYFENEKNT